MKQGRGEKENKTGLLGCVYAMDDLSFGLIAFGIVLGIALFAAADIMLLLAGEMTPSLIGAVRDIAECAVYIVCESVALGLLADLMFRRQDR